MTDRHRAEIQTDSETDRVSMTDRQSEILTDSETGRQTESQYDRQTLRNTDSETGRQREGSSCRVSWGCRGDPGSVLNPHCCRRTATVPHLLYIPAAPLGSFTQQPAQRACTTQVLSLNVSTYSTL